LKKDFITKLRPSRKSGSDDEIVKHQLEIITGEKFSWIDLQNPDRKDVEELVQQYNLNALNIEDCMTKFELPKLDSYDDHLFLILQHLYGQDFEDLSKKIFHQKLFLTDV